MSATLSKRCYVPELLLSSLFVFALGCSQASFQAVNTKKDGLLNSTGEGDAQGQGQGIDPDQRGVLDSNDLAESKTQSFAASSIKDESFQFTIGPRGVTSNFTLEDLSSNRMDSFSQIMRSPLSENFQQGNPSQVINEMFPQNARKGLVDIVVVIDNSGSMREEQVNLANKMNDLLVSIKDANWQISVITTAPTLPSGYNQKDPTSEGKEICQTTLIKAGEADAMTKFANAINAGTQGSGNEQGIRQAVVALRCTGKPWIRPTSTVAVLIVSDEDNCSKDGDDCGTLPWAKESYLTNFVENNLGRVVGKNAGFYGLVGPTKLLCPTSGHDAVQYLRLFAYKANGSVNYGNICDANYSATLNLISSRISVLLDNQFALKSQPEAGSLKISIKAANGTVTVVNTSAYTLIGKVVKFNDGQEPPAGSQVIADYKTIANPILKSFTLSQDPAAGSVSVKVNGQMLAATAYTVAGRSINFATPPPDMADIMVDFRQDMPLLTHFKPSATLIDGSLKVTVNGQLTSDFRVEAGELVFASAPLDGAAIVLQYLHRDGPRLSYTLPLSKDALDIKILDQGVPIGFVQVGNVFTISAGVHQLNKVLTLAYDLIETGSKTFSLPHSPLPNTLSLEDKGGSCDFGSGLEMNGSDLVSTCISATPQNYRVGYQYTEILRSFTLDGIASPDQGSWTVFIDKDPTLDFTRTGSTITLNFDPPAEAKVDIQYNSAAK